MAISHGTVLAYRSVGAAVVVGLALAACGDAEPADPGGDPSAAPSAVVQSANATPTTGEEPTSTDTPGDPGAEGAARTCPLLDAAEISAAIGHDVVFREDYSEATGIDGVCAYSSADETIQVTVMAVPESFAAETIQELQDAAMALAGVAAEPIDVGDGGHAFGHDSGGEAATVAGDLLLDVQVMSTSGPGEAIGNRKDAAISLLERLLAATS